MPLQRMLAHEKGFVLQHAGSIPEASEIYVYKLGKAIVGYVVVSLDVQTTIHQIESFSNDTRLLQAILREIIELARLHGAKNVTANPQHDAAVYFAVGFEREDSSLVLHLA